MPENVYVLNVYDMDHGSWHFGNKVFTELPNPHDVAKDWVNHRNILIIAALVEVNSSAESADQQCLVWDDATTKWKEY